MQVFQTLLIWVVSFCKRHFYWMGTAALDSVSICKRPVHWDATPSLGLLSICKPRKLFARKNSALQNCLLYCRRPYPASNEKNDPDAFPPPETHHHPYP